MMGFEVTLDGIARRLGGRIFGDGHLKISELAIDSRTMAPSPGTLFIALTGEQHDGHDYIRELYERGVRAFMVSHIPEGATFSYAGFCIVEDTLKGLQDLASLRREAFKGKVAAIAGSNGKTIVKEWIFQLLNDQFQVHRSPKSFNSQVGVPLSVWMTGPQHELALIEAGISRPKEMEKLQRIIRPDMGIFTNLGGAHQENFDSLEQKLAEKLQLFRGCERIICCSDQKLDTRPIPSFMKSLGAKVVDWSLQGNASYRYHMERRSGEGTALTVDLPGGPAGFQLPFSDDASIENALHAITFALEMGLPAERLATGPGNLEPVNMRLEILQADQGSILINDTYNSDTRGVSAALDLMDRQEKKRGRVVILSDLLQSGKEDRELYGEIAGMLDDKGIEQFIGLGPSLMHQRDLFPSHSLFYPDTTEFLSRMDRAMFRDRIILIKGSRKFGFERITAELQLKSHQTRLEIDLNAMVNNLNRYRSLLHDGVRTMVMVKALSYGSGNVEIASLLQFHHVDYLAVAFIDEGTELRKAGIHLPIMVLNPDPEGFDAMLDYQLEPEIYSIRILESLHRRLRYRSMKNYPIHIKLDTGMHRLGFQEDEVEQLISWLGKEEFHVTSVFSHLAASGDPDQDRFTRGQIRCFERISSRISDAIGKGFSRHLLNSSGIERFPEAQFDMVRLGIGLHGIGQAGNLHPVSSFKTAISQIRKIKKGESVGYARRGMTERDSIIATLPVGYADGFHRNLGNGTGKVWINGTPAPVIGDICMDMTMVDITGIHASEGDPVEIFGKNQSVSELAELAGTIPYEILTSIPERVKRVYLQE
jgi:alanine racemase